jgi:tetratricopeptide (TPR) repeat protein
MRTLRLETADFIDDTRFRWRLSEPGGKFLADHQVALDANAAEYPGYVDLHGYVRWNSVPESTAKDEQALVSRIARWVRLEVWGSVGDAILAAAGNEPVVIQVSVPKDAEVLLFRPFELGLLLDGSPGALDISLVYDLAEGAAPPPKTAPTDRLRILALFSMPTDQAALNVRRERHELRRLVRQVTATTERAIELHVLQYGVTRELLEDVLADGEGWDLIHFSGHGLPAGLVLEHEDGTADIVQSSEFAELLWPARARLKLAALSSCESGATTAAHAMDLLGLSGAEDMRRVGAQLDSDRNHTPLPAIAQRLATEIGCAAVAMRYPVEDEFAISLSAQLYENLLAHGQPLGRALQLALRKQVPSGGSASDVGLPVATPALFGSAALNLVLKPPPGKAPAIDPAQAKLAYFEPEPENFVGRVGPLAAANAALAPKSQYSGVLFHGMAGAGKTACALELAYRHEHRRFEAMAWHRAPGEEQDITSALAQFAASLETQLPGLKLVHVLDDLETLRRFLPRLRRLLADRSLLIALDNIESLLTPDGEWRDERWNLVIAAMIDHSGLSRLVLTSRIVPKALAEDPRLLLEPINSLSARESVLLARQLPNLGRLMAAEDENGDHDRRELVRRALELAQGNPKLIEIADRQAASSAALQARIAEADEAWGGEANLDAYFETGEADQEINADDFLRVIERWTRGIAETLTEEQQLLFQLICCLESSDRVKPIVELVWGKLWERQGHEGDPPDAPATLELVAKQGLIDIEGADDFQTYRMHPAVEQAERGAVDEETRDAIDDEMIVALTGIRRTALKNNESSALAWIGLMAAPYLLRRGHPAVAASFLVGALMSRSSPPMLAKAIPHLEQAVEKATGTDDELGTRNALLKARAALRVEDVVPEIRELLDVAREKEDFLGASVLLADLFNELLRLGRIREASEIVAAHPEFTRRAGLGPWSQIADEGMRLRLMHMLGEDEEVLATAEELRVKMDQLPERGEEREAVVPWNVRENLLGIARTAALALKRWQQALDINQAIKESESERDASAHERALTAFNDHGALRELDRLPEAEKVLRNARRVMEESKDYGRLGEVLSAWASLKFKMGHLDDAIAFQERALRLKYRLGEPDSINISHNNLANYFAIGEREPADVLAHRLATALISFQMESGEYELDLTSLRRALSYLDPAALPGSFDEMCARVERIEGVEFRALFDRLPQRKPNGDEALAEILSHVAEHTDTDRADS